MVWDGEWELPRCASRVLAMPIPTLRGMNGSVG